MHTKLDDLEQEEYLDEWEKARDARKKRIDAAKASLDEAPIRDKASKVVALVGAILNR